MDRAVLDALNLLMATPTRPFWALLAAPSAALLLVGGVLVLAWRRGNPRLLVLCGLSVLLSNTLAAEVLKPAIGRDRPCVALELHLSDPCGAGKAFPSAHAANTAALAAVALSPGLTVLAGLVGVGRVVVGQHWPSDVFGGWLLGAFVGAGVRAVAARRPGWT